MEQSIGDFAEQLLVNDQITADATNESVADPEAPDIRGVDVDDDMMSRILMESFGKGTPEVTQEVTPEVSLPRLNKPAKVVQTDLSEAYKTSLLVRLRRVKAETKAIIEEMTTVGMLGVNMAGELKDPFKKKRKKKTA